MATAQMTVCRAQIYGTVLSTTSTLIPPNNNSGISRDSRPVLAVPSGRIWSIGNHGLPPPGYRNGSISNGYISTGRLQSKFVESAFNTAAAKIAHFGRDNSDFARDSRPGVAVSSGRICSIENQDLTPPGYSNRSISDGYV